MRAQAFWIAVSLLWGAAWSWKDQWILNFEARALAEEKYCRGIDYTQNCSNVIPMFRPAKKQADYYQVIPHAIWQTWKTTQAAGRQHHHSMLSFLDQNPEYDYYLFDDTEALQFICVFFPELALIYQQAKPGAVKADLWRLAVMFRYGGVYIDTDSRSVVPLQTIIWPNASVVTGLGPLGDFHQWALIYAPRHVLMKTALKYASYNLKRLYSNQQGGSMIDVTGPGALHAAVRDTFQAHQCTSYNSNALQAMYPHDAPILIEQSESCMKKLGVMQVYNGDCLGNRVIFKHRGADQEKNAISLYYGDVEHAYSTLFQHVGMHDTGPTTVKIGQCTVDRADSKYRWKKSTRTY
jgi:hypothetical protein